MTVRFGLCGFISSLPFKIALKRWLLPTLFYPLVVRKAPNRWDVLTFFEIGVIIISENKRGSYYGKYD